MGKNSAVKFIPRFQRLVKVDVRMRGGMGTMGCMSVFMLCDVWLRNCPEEKNTPNMTWGKTKSFVDLLLFVE